MTGKQRQGSIVSAMLWMFFISLLLFWLPVFGPLLAGIVGGKKAGGIGAAILAVFLPAIIFGVVMFFLTTILSGLPVFGMMAGFGSIITLLVFNISPLLLGAVIGGVLND